jgi:hypothetical protein
VVVADDAEECAVFDDRPETLVVVENGGRLVQQGGEGLSLERLPDVRDLRRGVQRQSQGYSASGGEFALDALALIRVDDGSLDPSATETGFPSLMM